MATAYASASVKTFALEPAKVTFVGGRNSCILGDRRRRNRAVHEQPAPAPRQIEQARSNLSVRGCEVDMTIDDAGGELHFRRLDGSTKELHPGDRADRQSFVGTEPFAQRTALGRPRHEPPYQKARIKMDHRERLTACVSMRHVWPEPLAPKPQNRHLAPSSKPAACRGQLAFRARAGFHPAPPSEWPDAAPRTSTRSSGVPATPACAPSPHRANRSI